jgi:hypothetical protein
MRCAGDLTIRGGKAQRGSVSLRRRLARRSLKPQLNQIRTWVRQGRTDAWIAHQLEVSVGDIRGFKREHELVAEDEGDEAQVGAEELDLRAEDDALVAAALEAEQEAEDEEPEEEPEEASDEGSEDADEDDDKPKRRRRGRRGGRGRRRRQEALEGTFDHGEEGYGLWLDPAIQDDPVYAEHWAGHRPVSVTVEAERIIIIRAGEDAGADDDDED